MRERAGHAEVRWDASELRAPPHDVEVEKTNEIDVVSSAVATDRKATASEVGAHAAVIREQAAQLGLGAPLLREDGTVVIHSPDAGYHAANRLSSAASNVVGAYVHVITDDVPAAAGARAL